MIVRMMRMRVGGGVGCEGCCGGLDIGYWLLFLPEVSKCSLLWYFLGRLNIVQDVGSWADGLGESLIACHCQ
jgi:hypothetical protein